jgi:acetate kinase
MGMTPLERLVMGTRSGDIDSGGLTYVEAPHWLELEWNGQTAKCGGLLGLSELSNDCRQLEAVAIGGLAGAQVTLEAFVRRLARHIGGPAMSLPTFESPVASAESSVKGRDRQPWVVNTKEEWMIACDTAELAGLTRSTTPLPRRTTAVDPMR